MHSRGAIMTDDYSPSEILKGVHIRNIKEDIRICRIRGPVTVYDEHYKFICKLNKKKSA